MVSGKIDPDEFTVRRSLNDDSLVISDRKMGSKEMRIEMGGCGQAIVNRLSRNVYCLSDEDVLRLCRIGVYLEYCYGSPRDIEWAVHKVSSTYGFHTLSPFSHSLRVNFRVKFICCNRVR